MSGRISAASQRGTAPDGGPVLDKDSLHSAPTSFQRTAARLLCWGAALVFLLMLWTVAQAAPLQAVLLCNVVDEAGSPVAGVQVRIRSAAGQVRVLYTDAAGMLEYAADAPGEYALSFSKTGFFHLADQPVTLAEGVNEFHFTIHHETEIHEEVEVYSSAESLRPLETSHSETLIARGIRDIPVSSTHDLRSSLQTLPEVVRDRSGRLHIAGGRTEDTQHLLDGFDIGDPVSGELTARINVDSVRSVEAESGRFGVQYGRAGAGVLSLDTATGDDRWRAGATNFLPGISTQRGLHLSSWYPRLTLSGPLKKERAWFYEALSVQHTLSLVRELPPDEDSVSQWAGDNMLRIQIKASQRHILHFGWLYNQRNASNLGLGPFSPVATTRKARDYHSFYSFKEQLWSGRTFYEWGVAADFGHSESLPVGTEPYRLTPDGASGNYFESLRQKTRRWQALGSISMPGRRRRGTHDLQFGFNASESSWTHIADRGLIEVQRANGTLSQRTEFFGPHAFRLSDTSIGLYGHDVWRVLRPLVLQIGIRADWDDYLRRVTPSPRIAANLLPFQNDRAKLTASWGVFVPSLKLSSLGPAFDQHRSDTFFGADGLSPSFGPSISRFALPDGGLRQPRFETVSLGWEQSLGANSYLELNWTRRKGRLGLAYEPAPTGPAETVYVLRNHRRDSYRSLKVSFRHAFSDKSSLSASYTRSAARTNRIFDYSLDTLVFTPQQAGRLDWDAPNRLVSSGWTPARFWSLFLSYYFEYRSGFPFSVVNERQEVVGQANRLRFPAYLNLNVGLEKRIRLLKREWAVRLAILNVTNRANPDSVINNIDSPNFMKLAGGQKTAFTARLRLVG